MERITLVDEKLKRYAETVIYNCDEMQMEILSHSSTLRAQLVKAMKVSEHDALIHADSIIETLKQNHKAYKAKINERCFCE